MIQVDILEAKKDFSELIRLLEAKKEDFIIVTRNGKPVVKINPINAASNDTPVSKRIGIAKGKFTINDDFDAYNDEIAEMMINGPL